MRILLLTQWFEPEPTFKGLLFARELAARGHEVEVLTGFPNYPGGKLYPGYKIRPWRREEIDGISVVRVALYPSHNKSAIGRVLNYASFAVSAALLGAVLVRKPDLIYVYHPPATIALAAMTIGFARRAPFVYDIQDLWPDTLAVTGMLSNKAALALVGGWCNFLYRRARRLVVLSPGFRRQLMERGVPEDKIDVIYNWCADAAAPSAPPDPELASRLGLSGRFNVMFAGTMGVAQSLDSVLAAAALCQQTHPHVQFVFVGGGVDRERLEKKASDDGLNNVRFLARQPISAMAAVMELADVLLAHLKDDPLFAITIPSKTQAYMAAGKPILMAVRGNAADLVIQSGGGFVCEPENPASIAEAVARFAEMTPEQRRGMGENGRNFYQERLSLKAGAAKFETLFTEVRDAGKASFYRRFGKRLFDVLAIVPLLAAAAPILAITALCSLFFLGAPVLFRQRRPGLRERPFTLYKFRTMKNLADSQGRPLPDGQRLTSFGALLRRTSLDELPELWNVLRGDMSLVGPRPLLPEYLPRYTPAQRRRHEVKPGITGWAQVNGRNTITWEEKFEFDVWYVDHHSFWLDLKILWRTFVSVIRREGISQQGHATMPEFLGSARPEPQTK